MARVCLIIPIRTGSTRFPNKFFSDFNGKPLVQHSIDIAKKLNFVDEIILSSSEFTDEAIQICIDNEIILYVNKEEVSCGSEKVLEISKEYPDFDFYVTLPADEPAIDPDELNRTWSKYNLGFSNWISTLYCDFYNEYDLVDNKSCKIVTGKSNKAVYFSRSIVPGSKNSGIQELSIYKKHVGVFIFPKNLIRKKIWTKNYLSEIEGLEQNMFLDESFYCYKIKHIGFGVDSPEQTKKLEDRINGINT